MDHPFGAWSLLPPVVAIVLAIATRRVILSLLLGVAAGSMILHYQSPADVAGLLHWLGAASYDLAETRLWKSLTDGDHLRVFVFTSLMGSMVAVIHRSGGMHAVVDILARLARGRRGGQVVTWLLGMIVFFDDYANTLLLGTTMRPLADRLRISREKLAYLVDSTAAPVSGLAIVSTWVATEIGYIQEGFEGLVVSEGHVNGFDLFVDTIPLRFYVLFALALVLLVALLRRDFGPMLRAENAALAGKSLARHDVRADDHVELRIDGDRPQRWINAVLPVLLVVGVTVGLLLCTGRAQSLKAGNENATPWDWFSQGNSYVALLYGSLAGLIAAMGMTRGQRIASWRAVAAAATRGALLMAPALAILWIAWSLADVTGSIPPDAKIAEKLGTGNYLGDRLRHGIQFGDARLTISAPWLPTAVFVVSAFVAFSTGTSWGTMGLLVPLSIQVTHGVLADGAAPVSAHDPIMLATIGSVLAGAIFGDHCSPISDTTVLSSRACGCDHVAHVWTQLPYALLAGGVAILCGTLPAGFGVPVPLLLAAGLVAMVLWLLVVGRRVDDSMA